MLITFRPDCSSFTRGKIRVGRNIVSTHANVMYPVHSGDVI